jgi:hypothetical protein
MPLPWNPVMFEATRDFFNDALNFNLPAAGMFDIVLTLTGQADPLPLGKAIHLMHHLAPQERNYICCVLLERDQGPAEWASIWAALEAEAFE